MLKRILITCSAALLILLCAAIFFRSRLSSPQKIIPAPDTTILTSPTLPDGRIDYITAINQSSSLGVTPQNNAFVALLPALGTGPDILGPAHSQILHLAGATDSPGCWLDPPTSIKPEDIKLLIHTPWTPTDHPDISKWLDANKQALDIFTTASKLPRYWFPLVCTDSSNTLLVTKEMPGGPFLDDVIQTLCIRTMRNLGEKNPRAAWDDLLTARRLTRLLSQASSFVAVLAAMRSDNDLSPADQSLLSSGLLDSDLLTKMDADLRALPPFPSWGQTTHRQEIYFFNDTVQSMAFAADNAWKKQPIAILPAADWNAILRTGTTFFQDLYTDHPWKNLAERNTYLANLDAQFQAMNDANERLNKDGPDPHPGESSADFTRRLIPKLIGLIAPSYNEKFFLLAPKRKEILLLAIALERYRLDHKNYPNTLAQLAPTYVPTIPTDFYAKPLTYTHTDNSFILTSLGPRTDNPAIAAKTRTGFTFTVNH